MQSAAVADRLRQYRSDPRIAEFLGSRSAKELMNQWFDQYAMDRIAEQSESPCEFLFAVALVRAGSDSFHQQYPITIHKKRYRVDFFFPMPGGYEDVFHIAELGGVEDRDPFRGVVVEIDGHDFHERTKEQARRDRSRDRALTAAGYVVLRFTGSEVWRDPAACARDADSMANQRWSSSYRERWESIVAALRAAKAGA